MNLLRIAAALIGLVIMAGGYIMSMGHFFNGTTAEYVARLDASPIRYICLGLLVLAVVLCCIPSQDKESQD